MQDPMTLMTTTLALSAVMGHVLMAPGFPPAAALEFLPCRLLLMSGTLAVESGAARAWLAARTSEHFGDDLTTWETFDTLGRDYEGTLGELMRVASALE